ncbi:MAG: hypothetical protein RXR31_02065 [Thermoproteota archaeon]|jgi:hypothetical protein
MPFILATPYAYSKSSFPIKHETIKATSASIQGAFAFVSNFEDLSLDGWQIIQGTASVTTAPNYK